jgi:hypothetical protein
VLVTIACQDIKPHKGYLKTYLLWITILFPITGYVFCDAINPKPLTDGFFDDFFERPRSVLAELPRMRMVTVWHVSAVFWFIGK